MALSPSRKKLLPIWLGTPLWRESCLFIGFICFNCCLSLGPTERKLHWDLAPASAGIAALTWLRPGGEPPSEDQLAETGASGRQATHVRVPVGS